MFTPKPARLGVTGVVLLAALLALVFTAPSVRQAPAVSAGTFYNCPGGGGAVLISSGATCANLYPSCQYGGCPAQCNIGSCLQACSSGYAAAGCSISSCTTYAPTLACNSYKQQYCQTLETSYYGQTGNPGCSTNYNCGLSYSPYGCSVSTPSSCVGSVNTAPQQCAAAAAPTTSNCPGTLNALPSCAGGIIVCPGTGQLASAAQGCSVAGSGTLAGTANAETQPTACSGGTFATSSGCSASVVYQTCAGTGASVTSQSQCPVSCSNGQVEPPGSTCPSGSTPSTTTTTASTGTSGSAGAGGTVSLKAGWNLAAFPSGTQVSGTDAPLYALPPGSSAYQTLTSASSLPNGQGYWLHVPNATQITLAQVAAGSATIQLAAGQTVLIGNPGDTQATVTGADVVWVYDATAGWTQTTTLNPGQGAFAESAAGGTATITYGAAQTLPS